MLRQIREQFWNFPDYWSRFYWISNNIRFDFVFSVVIATGWVFEKRFSELNLREKWGTWSICVVNGYCRGLFHVPIGFCTASFSFVVGFSGTVLSGIGWQLTERHPVIISIFTDQSCTSGCRWRFEHLVLLRLHRIVWSSEWCHYELSELWSTNCCKM